MTKKSSDLTDLGTDSESVERRRGMALDLSIGFWLGNAACTDKEVIETAVSYLSFIEKGISPFRQSATIHPIAAVTDTKN